MEHTDTIECLGDDGEDYTVLEYTNFIEQRLLGGEVRRIEGMKTLMTSERQHVNYKSENEFEVVVTGVRLRRR